MSLLFFEKVLTVKGCACYLALLSLSYTGVYMYTDKGGKLAARRRANF